MFIKHMNLVLRWAVAAREPLAGIIIPQHMKCNYCGRGPINTTKQAETFLSKADYVRGKR